jgi:hypothetical protein
MEMRNYVDAPARDAFWLLNGLNVNFTMVAVRLCVVE